MKPLDISCFIITKNEEKNIGEAVQSVIGLVGEVIVIDSGSTDRTCEIAKECGATVVFNEWSGYLNQKQYGESLCRYDWVLNIDADEALSPELQQEIREIFRCKREDEYAAYNIRVRIVHRNSKKSRWIHRFAPYNICARLYDKKRAGFRYNTSSCHTHDSIVLANTVCEDGKSPVALQNQSSTQLGELFGCILHKSGGSISQLVQKADFYSSEQVRANGNNERYIKLFQSPLGNLRIVIELPLWIFKAFFIRRYFVFGMDGFIDCVIFSFARFLKLAKLRENAMRTK